MLADLARINGKAIGLSRHKLAFGIEEVDKLSSRHVSGRAGIESLLLAKAGLDGIYKFLLTYVSISLHHVEYFVSVCHIILL